MIARDAEHQLAESIAELAARAERSPDHRLAEAGHRCVERLRAPLRAAVVGRVLTGKSTLVNALLETSVLPTDGRKRTEVVHVFRYDRFVTAHLMPRGGGEATPVRFNGSRLLSEFDRPASEIRFIDVTLPIPLLEKVTLIDTPGPTSASKEHPGETAGMSSQISDSPISADVLLYCVNGPLAEDQTNAVTAFHENNGATLLSAGTAIGILNRADQIGGTPQTAWKQATELASTLSERHADLFAAVVPVIGLLAETAATGALNEAHDRALGDLARAWDRDVTQVAMISSEFFLTEPGPVGPESRRELLQLLSLYGIYAVLDRLQVGVPLHAAALTQAARDLSGIDEVLRQLNSALGRADVIRAARVLEDLIGSAHQAGNHSLHAAAQQVRDQLEMRHQIGRITNAKATAGRTEDAPGGIFISYRRQDDPGFAFRLYDRLKEDFDEDQIFMDIASIEYGLDFVEALDRALSRCRVLLAIIGPRWIAAVDENGEQRLKDPGDFVRMEIERALIRSEVRVIPILVDSTSMPKHTDLPKSLLPLRKRNACFMSHIKFRSDSIELISKVERIISGTPEHPQEFQSDSASNR